MADYKEMYLTLFRKVTMAITLLQEAQAETEELFINSEEEALHILLDAGEDLSAEDENSRQV